MGFSFLFQRTRDPFRVSVCVASLRRMGWRLRHQRLLALVLALHVAQSRMPELIHAGRLQELIAQHTDAEGMVHLAELAEKLEAPPPAIGQPQFQALTGVPKVLALIPARSGSKSVPHKNIRTIGGSPLIHHSIRHAPPSPTRAHAARGVAVFGRGDHLGRGGGRRVAVDGGGGVAWC